MTTQDGARDDERTSDEIGAAAESTAPVLLTIPQAGRMLAVGRTTVYALISSGELETVHIGRATRIPVESVHAFVEAQRRPRVGRSRTRRSRRGLS